MKSLRAAVIGVGYLGHFHAQKFAKIDGVELVAVIDTDLDRAKEVADEVGARALTDYLEIIDELDLVSIVVPTRLHHRVACDFLKAGVHVLLEKPITETVQEADELIALARERNLVFQVGHLERFNPAVLALEGVIGTPHFIESERLAPFKARGTDVNVVLDLMIHDIDIILNMVKSPLKTVNSVGTPVLSNQVDIANARLQFENGCVANVTASRVSREGSRKIRIFQDDAYISIDYQSRKISVFRKGGDGFPVPGIPDVTMMEKSFDQSDALHEEIVSFVVSVRDGKPPMVSGEDGRRALALAHRINDRLIHQVTPVN